MRECDRFWSNFRRRIMATLSGVRRPWPQRASQPRPAARSSDPAGPGLLGGDSLPGLLAQRGQHDLHRSRGREQRGGSAKHPAPEVFQSESDRNPIPIDSVLVLHSFRIWATRHFAPLGDHKGEASGRSSIPTRCGARYHTCMTHAMTIRLDDETFRRLTDLEAASPSRSAAVVAAIREAWDRLQEEKLEAAYAAAVAESPSYPFENDEERSVVRARRNARQANA